MAAETTDELVARIAATADQVLHDLDAASEAASGILDHLRSERERIIADADAVLIDIATLEQRAEQDLLHAEHRAAMRMSAGRIRNTVSNMKGALSRL